MQLTKPALFTGLAAAGLGYLLLVPNEFKIPCVFNYATGLQCPGCGLTRASLAILRGDIQAAYSFNQLVFYVPLFLVALYFANRSKHAKLLRTLLVVIGATATLGFLLVRNNII
ncbi:MAG: hypothetical protein RLY22_324 [Actinomycetota bacterium]|jgi:hypothetical protein